MVMQQKYLNTSLKSKIIILANFWTNVYRFSFGVCYLTHFIMPIWIVRRTINSDEVKVTTWTVLP